MSESTADIVGTTRANFTFTIDAATIVKATLINQPDQDLKIGASGREVTVPSLPASDSTVSLALIWAPADNDATINVGTVISGTVNAATPRHTIDLGDNPGFVELFGK
jgi:LysM repeat protein